MTITPPPGAEPRTDRGPDAPAAPPDPSPWWSDRVTGAAWTEQRARSTPRVHPLPPVGVGIRPDPGHRWPEPPTPPVRTSARAAMVAVVTALLVVASIGGLALGRTWPAGGPTVVPTSRPAPTTAPTAAPTGSSSVPSEGPSGVPSTPGPSSGPTATGSSPGPSGRPSGSATAGDLRVYRDVDVLVGNPFYDTELGPFTCASWAGPAPSGRAFETWSRSAVRCAHRFFAPAIEAAGYDPTSPRLEFFTGDADSPCGGGTGAFYCAADATIYVQRGVYDRGEGWRLNPARMLLHEYTHHLQARIGILAEARRLDREDSARVSRRIELQAACWSEMVMRDSDTLGWTEDDEEQLEAFNSVDSDARHGRADSRLYWYARALGETSAAVCNTWAASAERVA